MGTTGPQGTGAGTMRNSKTKRVYDYWMQIKGSRPAPSRSDISPRALKGTLPFLFIAERAETDVTVFRLAGTGLCERYGRELRDHGLESVWSVADRPRVRLLIDTVLDMPAPALAQFRAETVDCRAVDGEMLLLPIADETGQLNRILGCAFATESTAWLGRRPLVHQSLTSARFLHDAQSEDQKHQPDPVFPAAMDASLPDSEDVPFKGALPPLPAATWSPAGAPAAARAAKAAPGAAGTVLRRRSHLRLVVSNDTLVAAGSHQQP